MANYRLYYVKGAHFAGFDEFEAANDAQAIEKAENINGEGSAELGCGWRPEIGPAAVIFTSGRDLIT